MSETPRERAERVARKKVGSYDPYHIRNLTDAYELLIEARERQRCLLYSVPFVGTEQTIETCADHSFDNCAACDLNERIDKLLAEPKGEPSE